MSIRSNAEIATRGRIPATRRVSPALDGTSVLAAMRRHGAERLFGGQKLMSCFVDRVHFGSRIGVVVDYAVVVGSHAGGETESRIFGQLPWTDTDAAAARAERKLARARDDEPAGGDGAIDVLQIPEWGLLLRKPGHDERISGLWLLEPRRHWSRHMADDGSAELASRFDSACLLTHRFAKRAVLRLSHGRADHTPVSAIVKFYRRGSTAAETAAANQRQLWAALSRDGSDIAVPRVDAVFPAMSGLLMQDVDGVPLSALPDDERIAAMTAAGRALARLHGTHVEGLTDYSIADEVRLLSDWVEFTTTLEPASAAAFGGKLADVKKALAAAACPRPRPIHRDFHERQLILGSGSATLIDFDTIRAGDPAQDIGNFLAHLRLSEHLSGKPQDRARANFLDGYNAASTGEGPGARSIDAHERATLLRLVLINWFNERQRDAAVAALDGI